MVVDTIIEHRCLGVINNTLQPAEAARRLILLAHPITVRAVLIDAGIKTIFATSGSIKDEEVRKLCGSAGVRLVQLPNKDNRMFFAH